MPDYAFHFLHSHKRYMCIYVYVYTHIYTHVYIFIIVGCIVCMCVVCERVWRTEDNLSAISHFHPLPWFIVAFEMGISH